MGKDFNCYESASDKFGGYVCLHNKVSHLKINFHLLDVWRKLHPINLHGLILLFQLPAAWRNVNIATYTCRVWYKGQPIICNLCDQQGHKASACPQKDKCRLCATICHFARDCPYKDNLTPR